MTSPAPSRLNLFLGLGCLGLFFTLCLVFAGGFGAWRYHVSESARSHATSWAVAMVAHDYPGAFQIGGWGTELYDVGTFTMCMTQTPFATASTVDCHDTDVDLDGRHADVSCTLTTLMGPTEITIGVNNPTSAPYNGFVWFSPDALLGPAWHADVCATWSGQMYFRDPPPGRVRP